MGASRYGKILAAVALVALPLTAQGQGTFDQKAFQRDIDAGKVLIEQWIRCTQAATAKLASSSQESADVIAIAVFGVCSSSQEQLLQHFLRIKMTVPMADEYINKIKAKMREQIIAQAVTVRAK
jgi:hypothetical protein